MGPSFSALRLAMDELEQYTEFVYGELTGYVYAPIKKSPDVWEPKFYHWPEQRQEFHDWIRTNGSDPKVQAVYISPAVYKEPRATKDSIKHVQVAWVEFDGQEQIEFSKLGAPPNLIVQTSDSTHLHAYWKVDTNKPEIVEDINHRLTYFLDADTSGWDVTQILRPPNSWNRKPEYPEPFQVKLRSFIPGVWETKTFDKAPIVEQRSPTVPVEELLDYKQVLKEAQLPLSLYRRVNSEKVKQGSRSEFLMKVAYDLVEERLEHLQVVTLLAHVDERVGKFTGRSDRMLRLTQIADVAFHRLAIEYQTVLYTLEDVLHHTDDLTWVFPGWLHTSGFAILTSAPGVGKTQLCMQLATQLIANQPFLGKRAFTKREEKILFLSFEMDVRSLKYIISHQSKEWGELDHGRIRILDEQLPFNELEALVEEQQPTVIILDSLSEILGDSSDSNAEAKFAMRWIKKIRRRYNCAFIAIHHNRKANDNNKKPNKLSDLYGSFMFAKDADTVLNLWDVGDSIELEALKARFGIKGLYGKIKRNENLWFSLEEQDASNNTGSDPEATLLNFNFGRGGN